MSIKGGLIAHMAEDNARSRARLGSGEPGLNILLGGTLQYDGVDNTFGGAGAMSAAYRSALLGKDARLAAIAAGRNGSNVAGAVGGPGGSIGRPQRPEKEPTV